MNMLLPDELSRYSRQTMMEGWGESAQERLKQTSVFVAGAGGLGSPVAIYLAVAGIGEIRIADFDTPDLSNLNRQILHDASRIGINKALSAEMTLSHLNAGVRITPFGTRIEERNVDELVGPSALIVDCMDNFPTRYLLNDCARRKRIPLVHGSVWGMDGRVAVIESPRTACLSCLYPVAPPREVFPVVGATPGVIGSLQVIEALKILTGVGTPLHGQMLVWEGMSASFRTYRIRKDPLCPACGGHGD
jgi:adenylyltransferase/sulfurtransferase